MLRGADFIYEDSGKWKADCEKAGVEARRRSLMKGGIGYSRMKARNRKKVHSRGTFDIEWNC